jgi:hypothetical protein
MREIRQSGSEGGEPQPNAASLPYLLLVANAAMRWMATQIVQAARAPSGDGGYRKRVKMVDTASG